MHATALQSSSSSWREAISQSLTPLRSFARTVGPPLAAGPQSLLHPCRSRSGESRWSTVGHRRVSTPVKAAHHPSTWCRFVGSGLLVRRVEVWRRAQRDPVFACERCTRRQAGRYDAELHRWTWIRASWCADAVHYNTENQSLQIVTSLVLIVKHCAVTMLVLYWSIACCEFTAELHLPINRWTVTTSLLMLRSSKSKSKSFF